MNTRMRQQKEDTANPQRPFVAFSEKHTEDDNQQHTEGIISRDNGVFVKREIAETEQKLLQPIERRIARKKIDGHPRDKQMEHLHDDRRGGNAAERHQAEMPQPRMPLIFQVREELKHRRAISRQKPRLHLIAPHLVVERGETP